MYDFLTGPMLYASFAVFIIGLLVRVVMYIRGLAWNLDRVPYGYNNGLAFKWAMKSIFFWLTPGGVRSWRVKPIMCALFFLFHIGLVLVPIFLEAHNILLKNGPLGFSLPTLPQGVADVLTILAVFAGVALIVRRLVLPEVRFITRFPDWAVLGLSVAVLATGLLARYQVGDYNFWLLAHIGCGELILLAAPFTKLSHIVLFFCSRAQIGLDFGLKRGGERGRGLAW